MPNVVQIGSLHMLLVFSGSAMLIVSTLAFNLRYMRLGSCAKLLAVVFGSFQ